MPETVDDAAPGSGTDFAEYRLTLLGDVTVSNGGAPIPLLRRERLLVALLALQGSRPRGYIAGTLWPDAPEERARASLRQSVRNLKQVLPEGFVVGRGSLSLAPDLDVDVWDVRQHCDDVLSGGGGRLTVRRAVDAVNAIVGPELLLGEFDDWVDQERRRLQRQRLHALEHLTRELTRLGETSWAITAAEAAAELDPLREEPAALLIALHMAEGSVVEARRTFDSFRRRLRAELRVDPSPRVAALLR
ncbi:AfsR/SARP family transcriptional regulator [Xylanimonas sp. McL0601]|uniref:AfsR/SARP family transcriptional regulator n=1 Tax=Xylanimonas sp. McL0601 TaxID=3414739 RepID=UPI003CF6C3B3